MSLLSSTDHDAIELATLAAVAPDTIEHAHHWLIPIDRGSIGRAKSATPLWAAACDEASLDHIEQRYQAAKLPPAFRVPDLPHFADLHQRLQARGYQASRPTLVQTAAVQTMRELASPESVSVDMQPDAAWCQLFLGPGFDPVDGASRVNTLGRAHGNVFASLRMDGCTLSGGAGSFSHGWASVHGMRTVATHRGRGLATQVLAALAEVAQSRGLDRCFLQVEADNQAALALYRRAGFHDAWRYAYWARP